MNAWLYDFITISAEHRFLGKMRQELLSPLRGLIVELGAGTGANFAHYCSDAHVVAIEPDPAMMSRARLRAEQSSGHVELRLTDDSALELMEPNSVDIVVFSLVLCTIEKPLRAIKRAKRIVRSNGRFVVLEHVRGHGATGKFQDAVLPLWKRCAGGCRPNQETKTLFENAGFITDGLDQQHVRTFSPIQDFIVGTLLQP